MHTPGRLRQLIMRWEDWIFATEDAAARARGWQISRPRKGFGRTYRDPRWDLISACELCGGVGGSATEPCRPCGGSGRVRHDEIHAPLGGAA